MAAIHDAQGMLELGPACGCQSGLRALLGLTFAFTSVHHLGRLGTAMVHGCQIRSGVGGTALIRMLLFHGSRWWAAGIPAVFCILCYPHCHPHPHQQQPPPPIHRPLYTVHPLSPPASQSLPPRAPAPSTARCFRRRDLLLPRRDANPHALRKHGALVTGPPPLALSETPV